MRLFFLAANAAPVSNQKTIQLETERKEGSEVHSTLLVEQLIGIKEPEETYGHIRGNPRLEHVKYDAVSTGTRR